MMHLTTKMVLSFLVLLFVAGCSSLPPKRISYLEITKPPLKVVYIDDEGSITPQMIRYMINSGQMFPYQDYNFTDSTAINIDTNFHTNDHRSNIKSNTKSLSVDVPSSL